MIRFSLNLYLNLKMIFLTLTVVHIEVTKLQHGVVTLEIVGVRAQGAHPNGLPHRPSLLAPDKS